jgi:hypothetical protein
MIRRSSGVQEFRSSGVQEFRSSGVQRSENTRLQAKCLASKRLSPAFLLELLYY